MTAARYQLTLSLESKLGLDLAVHLNQGDHYGLAAGTVVKPWTRWSETLPEINMLLTPLNFMFTKQSSHIKERTWAEQGGRMPPADPISKWETGEGIAAEGSSSLHHMNCRMGTCIFPCATAFFFRERAWARISLRGKQNDQYKP